MSIFQNKVFWGIVITGLIGALTAIQAISPGWDWIAGVVGILTLIGHSSNVIKGAK